jgi:hypothetical protein
MLSAFKWSSWQPAGLLLSNVASHVQLSLLTWMCYIYQLGRVILRATTHTRLRARDHLHFKHSHWWKRWSRSNFASHYAWGTNGGSMWMQDGCQVYMDSYVASNESCCIVTWIIFKNHLLEIDLIQNQETMVLRMLITVVLFDLSCVRTCVNRNSLK